MQNNKEQSGFSYTYSASEQAQIKSIRDKYMPKTEEESKLERLRKLDARVTNVSQAVSLILGVLGSLTLGFGMSLIMTELSASLGLSSTAAMVIGIILGLVGGMIASLAYPAYNLITRSMRKKYAPEIIKLSDELTR